MTGRYTTNFRLWVPREPPGKQKTTFIRNLIGEKTYDCALFPLSQWYTGLIYVNRLTLHQIRVQNCQVARSLAGTQITSVRAREISLRVSFTAYQALFAAESLTIRVDPLLSHGTTASCSIRERLTVGCRAKQVVIRISRHLPTRRAIPRRDKVCLGDTQQFVRTMFPILRLIPIGWLWK